MQSLPLSYRNNLGCPCQTSSVLGAVVDYDIIVINGVKYTANQIVDKQLAAAKDTPVYKGDLKTIVRTVKAGQPLGRVYSYLKATGSTGQNALMLYDNPAYTGTPYYVKLDSTGAIDTTFLQQQGTMTVAQEIQAEKEKQDQENNPIAYYAKKWGVPVLLTAGAIWFAATIGKEYVKDKLLKKAA
jgi:hypothetical protein